MPWRFLPIFLASLLVLPAAYAAEPLEIGAGFYERCVWRGGSIGQMTTCLTFVMGMHEGVRTLAQSARVSVCFEGEARETLEPFAGFLQRNPGKLGGRTIDLYVAAMMEAYPCPRRPRL